MTIRLKNKRGGRKKIQRSKAATQTLIRSGSSDQNIAKAATLELAKALELPLRQGLINGDITDGIFEVIDLTAGPDSTPEFPLDLLSPGTEKDYVAYSVPNHGYIPQRHVESDYVMVPTYRIANSIGWNVKYAKNARWDVVSRATEVLESGFVKKINDDAWHTLITAGTDRNIVVLDSDAQDGQFTKRLVSLMKLVMRRNGGGNSASDNRGKLTDLYVSPEATEDIRNWNVDQVDEQTRREIFVSEEENVMNRIFGINLHDLDELGEGQEYQDFYEDELGASLPSDKLELVVGLDLRRRDSFVMPVKEPIQLYDDDSLFRMGRMEIWGAGEMGFATLDNRRVLLGCL